MPSGRGIDATPSRHGIDARPSRHGIDARPSRRGVLRACAGSALLPLVAGCSYVEQGDAGYVQLKAINGVTSDAEDARLEEAVLRVALSSPPGEGDPDVVAAADDWLDRFDTPATPTVDDDLHHDLRNAYVQVRYVVGVCSPSWADDDDAVGCFNAATDRETFNRVQVHQRVRASADGTSLTIHSVDGDWVFAENGG